MITYHLLGNAPFSSFPNCERKISSLLRCSSPSGRWKSCLYTKKRQGQRIWTDNVEICKFHTCLNVSRTMVSPLVLRRLSYSRRTRGRSDFLFICPRREPSTAPSSMEELAPWARYGSIGWHESPLHRVSVFCTHFS